jgi:hypothetical protein
MRDHKDTLFLDNDLNTKRYTEQAKNVINVIQTLRRTRTDWMRALATESRFVLIPW